MILYLDTEFNGFGGELISLALVEPGGSFFYGIRKLPEVIDPWVAEHVIPKLGDVAPSTDAAFRECFHIFLSKYHNPTIICDWHADAVHFFEWMAGTDYGSSLDFACQMKVLKTPPGYPKPKTPHNALSDAIALMEWNEGRAAA